MHSTTWETPKKTMAAQVSPPTINMITWQRCINGAIGLRVPYKVIQSKSVKYKRKGKPIHLMQRVNDTAYVVYETYGNNFSDFRIKATAVDKYGNYVVARGACLVSDVPKMVVHPYMSAFYSHQGSIGSEKVYSFSPVRQMTIIVSHNKKPLAARWGLCSHSKCLYIRA
jgi:hypothetical protein